MLRWWKMWKVEGSERRSSRQRLVSELQLFVSLLLLFFAVFVATNASAKSFGVQGETFEIAEEHLIEMIERKLLIAKEDGRLEALQDEMRETTIARSERPVPVKGIQPALEYRSFVYDPTVVAQQDYHDLDGNVVVAKGTSANPFDMVAMPYDLLFIDGNREAEVKWAMSLHDEKRGAVRIILLDGAPLELMRTHKVRVYFDQRSALANQFNLSKTPSRIMQQGRTLLIEEIPVEPMSARTP